MKIVSTLPSVTFLLLSCFSSPALAGKMKSWHHHRASDHDKAKFNGIVLSSEGTLSLSRHLRPFSDLDAAHVWSVIEDGRGRLFAATGDEGKLYRIDEGGRATVVYSSECSQVLSLCVSRDGKTVFAGTGPEATIVSIDERGAKKWCSLPESYVWAIAPTPAGDALYAATGPHGRIYRITADGKATIFYETKQDHVLSLVVASDGTTYAGTDKTGRIYRIQPNGKGFVLHQTDQAEIRTLLLDGDVLYAGTSSLKLRNLTAQSTSSSGTKSARIKPKNPPVRVVSRENAVPLATNEKVKSSQEASKGVRAEAPSTPSSGENSVYRISSDGAVEEIFRDKVLVMSLAKLGNRLIVASGMKGELFEVDLQSLEKTSLAKLDHGQILSAFPRKDGSLILSVGDPGRLYVLGDGFVSQGTLISPVLDAKHFSRWGAMRSVAAFPDNTTITVATRSGNVAEADETWSDWSEEQDATSPAKVLSPYARFLQYRLTLHTENPQRTPAVKSVLVWYANRNLPPSIKKIEVPNLTAENQENPKKVTLKWTAEDANEDRLRFSLFVKKDGWKDWISLEDDFEKSELEWDSTTTPTGTYRLKIIASDHPDNGAKDALVHERISEPFVVCHAPPKITLKIIKIENGKAVIEAKTHSTLVRLISASFAVNGKQWHTVAPSDGLFDDKSETFCFRAEVAKPGAYVVVFKVRDAAGNVGSSDVTFSIPPTSKQVKK